MGDCARWYSGGTPDTSVAAYWGGDIPWITASSLHDFYIIDSNRKVTRLGLENGTRVVPEGSVLFVVRGMSLKTEFRVGVARRPVAFGQDCKALVPYADVDSAFLAYALRGRETEILGLADEASHGTGRLQTEALARMEVALPPVHEQRAIAAVLGALDDKIEINRRMNQTLEAMAQALFKSWFVDFDPVRAKAEGRQPFGMDRETAALFPDSFEDSEIGTLPRGWAAIPFSGTCQILSGGTPKTGVADYWGGTIPWVSVADTIPGPYITTTARSVTEAGVASSAADVLPIETVVITARGTVGNTALLGEPMAINQSCYGLRGDPDVGQIFLLHLLREQVGRLRAAAHGSVFDTITRGTFDAVVIARPPAELLGRFDAEARPLFGRILSNQRESQTLAAIRDALLPKLLSGEVRVPEAERVAEAAL